MFCESAKYDRPGNCWEPKEGETTLVAYIAELERSLAGHKKLLDFYMKRCHWLADWGYKVVGFLSEIKEDEPRAVKEEMERLIELYGGKDG
jgi:hypothetical protein